jgi:hypothetical protein
MTEIQNSKQVLGTIIPKLNEQLSRWEPTQFWSLDIEIYL